MRKKRLDAIRRHILRSEISTQEELQTALLSEDVRIAGHTFTRSGNPRHRKIGLAFREKSVHPASRQSSTLLSR